ncbi:MAG: CsbD family protein [Alphaproteobacteria bacterium]|nr:CsbD family protein [Alphaproteobacteria bacterium]MBV9370363.1 CsbD family protein [Alphaproteobacteria bacterium]MBV9901980.1 CsbD family protein [Alphaproteobacteria bacterium]
MGEFTDRLKGAANQMAGDIKQESRDPEVRDEGDAQKLKGKGQELKGKVKGVINDL